MEYAGHDFNKCFAFTVIGKFMLCLFIWVNLLVQNINIGLFKMFSGWFFAHNKLIVTFRALKFGGVT